MNNLILSKVFADRYNGAFMGFAVFNVTVRVLSMALALFLNFYLAKFLSVGEYGVYGIIYSSVIIGVYLMGLDIYVITTRELCKFGELRNQKQIVYHQMLLYLASYVVLFPVYLIFLYGRFITTNFIFFLAVLLILEHLSQECVRICYALRYIVISNIIIFCRRILWPPIFLLAAYINKDLLTLETLLTLWIVGDVTALLIGIHYGFKIKLLPVTLCKPDIKLIGKIIRGALVFLGASITLRILIYSGNYFIKYYFTFKEVGVFNLFTSILSSIDVFIYASLVSIFLPKIIESRHKNEVTYRRFFKKFSFGILILVAAASIALIIFIKPFLLFIGKPQFLSNLKTFYILLAGFVLFGISNVPHYILYVNEAEKVILYSSVAACAVNMVLNCLFVRKYGLVGCAVAFLLSMVVLFIVKLWGSRAYIS